MIDISLNNFLRRGELGPIALRTSEEKIKELLGQPDREGRNDYGYCYLRYGDMQLHISPLKKGNPALLRFIEFENFQTIQGGERITFSPDIIRGGVARSLVEQHLITCQIPYQPKQLWDLDATWLYVGPGIRLVFIEDSGQFDTSRQQGLWHISFGIRNLRRLIYPEGCGYGITGQIAQ